jgi:hypothetical protein
MASSGGTTYENEGAPDVAVFLVATSAIAQNQIDFSKVEIKTTVQR